MMRRKLTVVVGALATLLIIGASTLPVFAASSPTSGNSGNGLSVSPLTTNLVINAGQSQVVPVDVQNVTNAPVTIQVDINDFTAGNNENGRPELLLNPGQYAPSHSLKRFITPIGNLTLQAGQQKTVNVNISIPKGTAGGGYYGAVRFVPITVSGGKTITLTASVASLILVRVPGDVIDDLQLMSLGVQENTNGSNQAIFFSNKNLIAAVQIKNVGNVQEQPFGKIVLKNGNKQLGIYNINNTTPPGNVLPDSIRIFTVPLTNVGILGKYTLEGNFGYGTNGQLLSGSTTFYVVPLSLIVAIIVIILVILFLIFVLPRMIKSYNRRVVRRARR